MWISSSQFRQHFVPLADYSQLSQNRSPLRIRASVPHRKDPAQPPISQSCLTSRKHPADRQGSFSAFVFTSAGKINGMAQTWVHTSDRRSTASWRDAKGENLRETQGPKDCGALHRPNFLYRAQSQPTHCFNHYNWDHRIWSWQDLVMTNNQT